ncbi:MAG TPA: MBL fold metallo-hydrolase [Acidothermaceae bacterium]|jgi:ribonuclease J
MRVRIHRGSREIGGSCVEVEADGARLVLDVGKPLSAGWNDEVPLPAVPGLGDGDDTSLLGVLISHSHLDHYGLLPRVSPHVPIYAGAATASMMSAAGFFSRASAEVTLAEEFVDRQPIAIEPFTVTPFLADHSAFDAYSLLVEAGGRRLFYSGDIRGHGRKASLFDRLVAQPPLDVHALLLEGTHIGRTGHSGEVVTRESDVEAAMAATFRSTVGLAAVVSSAQNIDRLVTVYRACLRAGRTLLVDLYSVAMAQATGRSTIPQPGFPSLGVLVPQRQRVLVKTSGEFDRTAAVQSVRVFPEAVAADTSKYVVLGSSGAVADLLPGGLLGPDGVVVWSLWPGYLGDGSGSRFAHSVSQWGVPFVIHHTSGHAPVADLQRLVEAMRPERVVPIHTEGAAAYGQYFAAVEHHEDGEWWGV